MTLDSPRMSSTDRKHEAKQKARLGYACLCFIGAFCGFALGWMESWQGWRSQSWPTVQGEMVRVGTRDALVSSSNSSKSLSPSRQAWQARVDYRYKVGGRIYTMGRIHAYTEISHRSESAALAEASRWKPGDTVTVHYNPADPEFAVLVPGFLVYDLWGKAVLGLVFLAGGIGLLMSWRKNRTKAEPSHG